MAYTFETANDYEPLEEGDYEMEIEKAEVKTLPSGKEKLSFMLRVRSDVEQKGKNRVIFEDIWRERENPEFFNRRRLNQLLGTQKLDDGHVFDDINAIIEFLQGKYLIAHVVVKFDDYRQEDRNSVAWYKKSEHGVKELGGSEEPQTSPSVNDDDLPF